MKPVEHHRMLALAESHLAASRRQQAKLVYQQILLRDPKSTESHFQLAVLLHDDGDLEGAVQHFQRLLQLSPKLAEVHFNLGTLLAGLGRKQEAAESFRRAAELQPSMAEAHNNLGIALRDLGDAEGAVECFESAIRHAPRFVSALLNLGTTLIKLRRPERAVEVCRRARDLNPEIAEAHLSLGLALELSGEIAEAAACIHEAVRRNPESAEWSFHLAATLGLTAPAIAPAEYVASLFDAYAARFEEHLRGALHYQTPEHILKAVRAVVSSTPDRKMDVLDLGCGTGLCGRLFRPYANRLVGIDLSPEMIREASRREIYSEVAVSDIAGFLQGRTSEFDLILAADVFVYVGDLSETFRLASTALRPNGLFAFSVEAAEESPSELQLKDATHPELAGSEPHAGYRLNASRRYSHTLAYVRRLAAEHGFSELSSELTTLRRQAGSDVQGWILVISKVLRATVV